MIQIQINGVGVIVLEPKNIEYLKAGNFLNVPMQYFHQPLSALVIDWTPDLPWVAEQLTLLYHGKNPAEVDPRAAQKIIRDSQSRPEVSERPDHPCLNLLEKLPTQ